MSAGSIPCSIAATNSPAVAYLSAGTFANAFSTTLTILSGTPGRTTVSVGTFSPRCYAMIACGVRLENGGSPASIPYNTHPSE